MTQFQFGSHIRFRKMRMPFVAALMMSASACTLTPLPPDPPIPHGLEIGAFQPPRISPPAARGQNRSNIDLSQLPDGARARLPGIDGAPLFVSLPATMQDAVVAQDIFDNLISPVLRATGADLGRENFRFPPSAGNEMARADLKALTAAVEDEYAAYPEFRRPKTQTMLDALAGRVEADATLNRALQMGEGMTFDQYVAGIERLQIQFPFQQIHGDTPIEHTLLLATRWEEQSVTALRGTVIANYQIQNSVILNARDAQNRASQGLVKLPGMTAPPYALEGRSDGIKYDDRQLPGWRPGPEGEPVLVLLPYGTNNAGTTQLRYAYRLIGPGYYQGQLGAFQMWVDAADGSLLQLIPLIQHSGAKGEVYNRDPGRGTRVISFTVDGATGSQYTLQQTDRVERVDYLGDGYDASDVSISDSSGGSSATLANFDQSPINDEANAICQSSSNKAFQQVSAYGWLNRYIIRAHGLGVFAPFPRTGALGVTVESNICNGFNDGSDNLTFGYCGAYTAADCPNTYVAGADWLTELVSNSHNTAHDNTWLAHELAHSLTPRFTNLRPADWCGSATCSIPVGWSTLHDLADFWADHFENTNCWSGWFAKNNNASNGSLNCVTHHEGNLAPRAHQVSAPFDPADPLDHFPEHRSLPEATDVYSDMQIASAALWQVRLGMRSKCRPSGLPQFAVRFARALKNTTFFTSPTANDAGILLYLRDLETELIDEWASAGSPGGPPAFRHNGPHTTNKVTAGFARTGVFLEDGADAVIDIDDNDAADDIAINGVTHRESDFLELGGPAPSFHVWTGPRFGMDATGAATFVNPSPCNAKYLVDVSTNAAFSAAATQSSGWINVDRDPSTPSPECYALWQPSPAQWTALQSGGAMSLLYYRVRTRDAADLNERNSTQPGNATWTVDPPYAVITADGQSDY